MKEKSCSTLTCVLKTELIINKQLTLRHKYIIVKIRLRRAVLRLKVALFREGEDGDFTMADHRKIGIGFVSDVTTFREEESRRIRRKKARNGKKKKKKEKRFNGKHDHINKYADKAPPPVGGYDPKDKTYRNLTIQDTPGREYKRGELFLYHDNRSYILLEGGIVPQSGIFVLKGMERVACWEKEKTNGQKEAC
jgi:hypothetical protein